MYGWLVFWYEYKREENEVEGSQVESGELGASKQEGTGECCFPPCPPSWPRSLDLDLLINITSSSSYSGMSHSERKTTDHDWMKCILIISALSIRGNYRGIRKRAFEHWRWISSLGRLYASNISHDRIYTIKTTVNSTLIYRRTIRIDWGHARTVDIA